MQNRHTSYKIVKNTAVFAFLLLLIQPFAIAQSDGEILDSVRSCQSVAGLSSRLSCYDLLFPPTVEVADTVQAAETVENNVPLRARDEQEQVQVREPVREPVRVAPAPRPQSQPIDTTAQIIEVSTPNIRSFRLVAADGRIFSQSNATSTIRWPETPFNVEIETGLLGTKYVKISGRSGRIRVQIED